LVIRKIAPSRHRLQAERDLPEAEARVTRQGRIVERLASQGLDTSEARMLLTAMEAVPEQMRTASGE
jgi:hypothetical protein